jgi:hypothetical protein
LNAGVRRTGWRQGPATACLAHGFFNQRKMENYFMNGAFQSCGDLSAEINRLQDSVGQALGAGDESIAAYAQKRFKGAFRRVISLPEDADPTRINAVYRDGLLRVTVARREASRPSQINIS